MQPNESGSRSFSSVLHGERCKARAHGKASVDTPAFDRPAITPDGGRGSHEGKSPGRHGIVTHLYNAMSQLGHRTPGLVGAALVNPRVICGFIADGFHVHEIAGRIAYNAKGPGGVALISDAMPPAASGPSVYELQGRRVNQVGLKLTLDDGTLAGAAITMLDAVRYSVSALGIDVAAALEMATLTLARLLRIDDSHGRLRAGARADLVHLSDDLDLKGVWIAGDESAVFGRSEFPA
jgi:N-acetylglucosamine-6-phosphate deacetylase